MSLSSRTPYLAAMIVLLAAASTVSAAQQDAAGSPSMAAAPTEAAPAPAADPAAAPAPATTAVADPDKVICKMEQVTGSHFPKRICRTQAEIDATREAAQNSIRDIQGRGRMSAGH